MASIEKDRSYQKPEFMKILGIKEGGWKSLVDAGLKTKKAAGKVYVIGQWWFDFLDGSKVTTQNDRHANTTMLGAIT